MYNKGVSQYLNKACHILKSDVAHTNACESRIRGLVDWFSLNSQQISLHMRESVSICITRESVNISMNRFTHTNALCHTFESTSKPVHRDWFSLNSQWISLHIRQSVSICVIRK